ncbi:protocadherin fat-like protein [Phytophthora cinnamomi]|uniref:protocadherin fat-like protein n=1 Tax=Phytophthora cinnamomi TaxID=4785 RepID=UPI003559B2FD|nr:protocadherin fat-like protein [Phytophthora cinnamomi]
MTFISRFGLPVVAQQAELSKATSMFTGWISRFHYFAGAISLDQVEELTTYSVPSFYNVAGVNNVDHETGKHFCNGQRLRLCDPIDFTTLCVEPMYSPLTFPSASQGIMTVPACQNLATRAEQNARDANLACCSQGGETKLIGETSHPVIKADAITASSFLNSSRKHGYGYDGLDVVRSDSVDADVSIAASVVFPNVVAKQLRIIPTSWIGSPCLRLELFGPDTDITLPNINEPPTTPNLSLSVAEGTNSNPTRALPTKMYAFPILSSSLDYVAIKKATGGGVGEVSAYDRSSALAAVLEITAAQVSQIPLIR